MANFFLEYLDCVFYVIGVTVSLSLYYQKYLKVRLAALVISYSYINYLVINLFSDRFIDFLAVNSLIICFDFLFCCLIYKRFKWHYLFYTITYYNLYNLMIGLVVDCLGVLFIIPIISRIVVLSYLNLVTVLLIYIFKNMQFLPNKTYLKENIGLYSLINLLFFAIIVIGSELNYYLFIFSLVILIIWLVMLKVADQYIQTKKENEKLIMTNMMNENLDNFMKSYHVETEKMKMIKHDLKKHQLVLENLRNDEYVKDMFASLDKEMIQTGNIYIDACFYGLIKTYSLIDFRVDTVGLKRLKMNNKDLVALIFNVVDNACQAASKTDQKVQVKMMYDDHLFKLCVINKYTGKLNLRSKQGKDHGYGLKIIKNIVSKYDGDLSIIDHNKTVTIGVTLNVE